MIKKTKIAAGLLMASFLAFSAISALAAVATGTAQIHAVAGTVSAISGTKITLKTANNGPTYTIDASKASISQGKSPDKLSNIKNGEIIIARGTLSGTTLTASSISTNVRVVPETVGTISAINGNNINVFANNTTYTVDASKAKILNAGKTMKVSDLKNGDSLIILGTITGTNIAATSIFEKAASTVAKASNFIGTIKAVNGNSFTFQPRQAKSAIQTVNTASNTIFMKNNAAATANDLAAGRVVLITGIQDTTNPNTINASKVQINTSSNLAKKNAPSPGFFTKIFNAIANFFKKIF